MKQKHEQPELSYYGLYLLRHLQENRFPQADDKDFIAARAAQAAETYEQARLEGRTPDGAQELAMAALLKGLHHSKYNILHEVIENEFSNDIPPRRHEAFTEKLLPLVDNVFSIYNLSNDDFLLSEGYSNLYLELTGAVALYLEAYGVQ